jgi:hypothetical protein
MKKLLQLATVLFIALFVGGCDPSPYETTYQVRYGGNGHTAGQPPIDPRVYFSGEMVTVLAPPVDMKKGDYQFLGWRWRYDTDKLYQFGDTITMRYENIYLYAEWSGSDNPFTYEIDPDTNGVTITKYDGIITDFVHVPKTIEGKPVIRIGFRAFKDLSVSNITLPNGLRYIDEEAFSQGFSYYNSFQTIAIPDTVETIGIAAFRNGNLKDLQLGSGVKTLGAYAFANNYLRTISFDDAENALESIGDFAFEENLLTVLIIPENIKTVGIGAFSGNAVMAIKIGASVSIGSKSSFGAYGDSFLAYYSKKGKQPVCICTTALSG